MMKLKKFLYIFKINVNFADKRNPAMKIISCLSK